jgi:outer membrane immunogenic protein
LRWAAALAFSALARIAAARTDLPWDGFYFGGHVGDALGSACESWALTGAIFSPEVAAEFNHAGCPKIDSFEGGLQVGENFQSGRLVWGVGADLDYSRTKSPTQSLKYAGAIPPPSGTYSFASKSSPAGFAVIGPRIGYGGDTWLPFVRAGAIVAFGSHDSSLFYSPTGAAKPGDSFAGGSSFSTVGWASGAGFELGLNGAWSITAEYLHASLGRGSTSKTVCSGSASTCAGFSAITLDTIHAGYSANIIRVGMTYWFEYW